MIVIGYQGIGKSSLAGKNNKYIDLESGNFWVDGKRADDWYKIYGQIAEHLSKQGYIVFTSSHEVVRKWFSENGTERVVVVFPSLALKDEWINKLNDRFVRTGLEKDYKVLMNAVDRYAENIAELMNSGFECLVIDEINYNLEYLVEITSMVNHKERKLQYMRIDPEKLNVSFGDERSSLIYLLPDIKICDVASVLIFKDGDNFYVVKMRQPLKTDLSMKDFVYIKKGDDIGNIDDFCINNTYGFIIFDITGVRNNPFHLN